jgi:lipopolysaccharide biosynthesis glycosyltransferase
VAPPPTPAPLPIACGINDGYVLPLLVMLTSLRDHLGQAYRPVLYLLHRGLPDQALEAVSRVVELHPVALDATAVPVGAGQRRFPVEAAAPLMLGDLLPADLSRVIFLDADLLVVDDLADLWNQPLDGRVLGAVPDAAVRRCGSPRGVKDRDAYGVPDDAMYFNAGVMLISLAAWRERSITPRALEYLARVGDRADFLHQEALNAVAWHDWHRLPDRWNLLGSVAGRPFDQPPTDAWRAPAIVHFAGRLKPWRMAVGGQFRDAYDAVLTRVAASRPPPERSWVDWLYGLYDRRLRDRLYPYERLLWNRRLL